jgi:hypothetical protein
MKKLFLSFSTLLRAIADGHISAEDLQRGLFMFGCTRGHALEPGAKGEADERKWNKGKNAVAHPILVNALLEAETAGRVAWLRDEDGRASRHHVTVFNELMLANSLPQLKRTEDFSNHSYPEWRSRIEEECLPLEPLF